MPIVPQELLQEILQRTDLVLLIGEQVALRRNGRNYTGLCPFHQEKTPSFHVDADRQFFYCFGCQSGGNAFTFIQKRENLSFMEAVELLAERAGVTLPDNSSTPSDDAKLRAKRRIYDACQAALMYFRQQFKTHPEAGKARRYAIQRQLTEETIEQFQMGYAPADWRGLAEYLQINGFGLDILELAGLVVKQSEQTYYDRFRDRLIFPIFDFRGRCIAFGGRQLVDDPKQPKYLNSPQSLVFDKGHTLYGIHLFRGKRLDEIVVYEGYMDLISAWQAGCVQGAASLGTALTQEHCRLLKRYTDKVVLCYDADNAGRAATERGMFLLQQAGLEVRVAKVPQGKDPDDFIRLHGGSLFREQVLQAAPPLLRYCKENLKKDFDVQSIEGKSSYVREFLTVLAKAATPIEEEEYMREMAAELNLTLEAIYRERQLLRNSLTKKSRTVAARGESALRQGGTASHHVEQKATLQTSAAETSYQSPFENSQLGGEVIAPGRLRAEQILLALALSDVRFALKLADSLQTTQFADPQHRVLAGVCWDYFRSQLPVGYILGTNPELSALVARLGFIEATLESGRELAFSEAYAYILAEALREELMLLGERCKVLQESGDDAALMESLRRTQEVQRQLAAMRGGQCGL